MSLSALSAESDEPLGRFHEALTRAEKAADGLGAEVLPEALGKVEELKARLWVRLYGGGEPCREEDDRLLAVEEAAQRLSISTDTLYRKARHLPFTVRIGGNVRFSAQGISRFIATRQSR